ncbi:hypothetical protein ZWY2020_006451 [Hordeum vulgare]|nr:hypothetical protein ZWY2020_006451 [Hordeum vulgare]
MPRVRCLLRRSPPSLAVTAMDVSLPPTPIVDGSLRLLPSHAMDTIFSLCFALLPMPATGMLLKVDSSSRLRALSMTYSPMAARATLLVGCSFYRCRLQPL